MSSAIVRALRGASTCAANTSEEISVLFTTTPDLNASFPATAARGIGFGDVPLLCASEIDVRGAMPLTVRVLLHAYTERARSVLRHVYLRNTSSLRDDHPE